LGLAADAAKARTYINIMDISSMIHPEEIKAMIRTAIAALLA
jgi:hypothetical protein